VMSEPDGTGEYPVLVLDNDDQPYMGIMYPGFDVYLAYYAGLLAFPSPGYYTMLSSDPRYQARHQEHADYLFKGQASVEVGDSLCPWPDGWSDGHELL
jgi:hypothetical protein